MHQLIRGPPPEEVSRNCRLRSYLYVFLHPLVEVPTEMAYRELGEEKGAVEKERYGTIRTDH